MYAHWRDIRKVCVIGAGTMGSGIAAHLANLGFQVTLLDLTQDSVEHAFGRARTAKPPHFFLPETADKIRLGSIEKGLGWAADCDWVCEAIIEKLDAKKALFEQLDQLLPESVAITTNTSGLEIGLLSEGRSESFKKRFMGTHFFNPPRYLKLLELIPTEETDPEAVAQMSAFLEEKAARRVVLAKDTPGFIANRFGMWAMFHAIHTTEKLGLSIEQVDAITGPFLGRPRSGSFRLNDIVGLDIMLDIARNLYSRCPEDPYRDSLATPASMMHLLEKGWIGEKAGQGYYRREGKEFMALDLATQVYRQRQDVSLPSLDALAKAPLAERLRQGLQLKDEAGEFLREHLLPVLQYANYLKEEISHSVLDFDRVMMWGFGWEAGPFAMMDMIGGLEEPFYRDKTQRSFAGGFVPLPDEPQYKQLADYPVVETHQFFKVRDLGEGVHAVALTTKMGTINPGLTDELDTWLDNHSGRLVLTSEARHFSLGFDLTWFKDRIEAEEFEVIDEALYKLQMLAVKLSKRPIVAAIHGYCLGAGLELAFQCPQVAALSDVQIGFPESKIGLFPGGGGTAELGLRARAHGLKPTVDLAVSLALGEVAGNADSARAHGVLRPADVTVYHPERLLTEARALALEVDPQLRLPWAPLEGPLVGMIDKALDEQRTKGNLTDYDVQIGDKIKLVLAKSTSFDEALGKERQHFVELCRQGLTLARIKHMLETGKPLRS